MAPTVVETTQGEVVILTYKQASKDIITAMQKAMTNTAKTDEQAPRKIPLAAHLGAELTAQDPAAHLGAELSCGDRETELVVCKPQSLATADRQARPAYEAVSGSCGRLRCRARLAGRRHV